LPALAAGILGGGAFLAAGIDLAWRLVQSFGQRNLSNSSADDPPTMT
jgi:hypothetical protein